MRNAQADNTDVYVRAKRDGETITHCGDNGAGGKYHAKQEDSTE